MNRWINDDRLNELIGGFYVGAGICGGVAAVISFLLGLGVLLALLAEAVS